MTVPNTESFDLDPAFPDTVDDSSPERERIPDPQEPALPGDHYVGVFQVGTTVQEEIDGESLNRKMAREVPDTDIEPRNDFRHPVSDTYDDVDDEAPVGRLVQPDQGSSRDNEPDAIASAYLEGESDVSAEEAAMHVHEG